MSQWSGAGSAGQGYEGQGYGQTGGQSAFGAAGQQQQVRPPP